MKNRRKWLALCLAAVLLLTGCANAAEGGNATDPQATTSPPVTGNLICVEISRFSGSYVEDGKDQQVRDVAAILVGNNTGKFVDLAIVSYRVGNRTLEFRVTGLPAGRKVWVLESKGQVLKDGDELELLDCQESYNANPITSTDDLTVVRQGKTLQVTNSSGKKLSNVVVYYKNTLEDGTFLGGITYVMNFGEMESGATASRSADHFNETSEIVRFSYQ